MGQNVYICFYTAHHCILLSASMSLPPSTRLTHFPTGHSWSQLFSPTSNPLPHQPLLLSHLADLTPPHNRSNLTASPSLLQSRISHRSLEPLPRSRQPIISSSHQNMGGSRIDRYLTIFIPRDIFGLINISHSLYAVFERF